jgi:hypothetical protein
MAPRVATGCRPHGAGSVFGSAGIIETTEAVAGNEPSHLGDTQDASHQRLHQIGLKGCCWLDRSVRPRQ